MRVVSSAYGRRTDGGTRGVAGPRRAGAGARAARMRGGRRCNALVAAGVLPAGVWR
jgi:hypothetical protein